MTDHERYVTIPEVEDELPFDRRAFGLTANQWSNVLERHLSAASDDVEKWTGTVFTAEQVERNLSRSEGVDPYDLPLPETPIESVKSITVNGTSLSKKDDVIVHDTHLELQPDAPVAEWPTESRSINVTWTYGYDEVPAAVERAIIRLVRTSIDQIKVDGLVNESLPGGSSYSYRPPSDTRAEVKSNLDGYTAPTYSGGTMVI